LDARVPPFEKGPAEAGPGSDAAASRLFLVLLAGLVLPALLSALAGLLGLLTRVALLATLLSALTGLLRLLIRVALLAALVRIALVLLSTLVLVSHLLLSFCWLLVEAFNALHMGSRLQPRHVFLVIRPLQRGLSG